MLSLFSKNTDFHEKNRYGDPLCLVLESTCVIFSITSAWYEVWEKFPHFHLRNMLASEMLVQVIIIKGLVIHLVPVDGIKSISDVAVYFFLDGANEVAASGLEKSDRLLHRFGLEGQMRQGHISGDSLQEELHSFLLAPTYANYDCLFAFCAG